MLFQAFHSLLQTISSYLSINSKMLHAFETFIIKKIELNIDVIAAQYEYAISPIVLASNSKNAVDVIAVRAKHNRISRMRLSNEVFWFAWDE